MTFPFGSTAVTQTFTPFTNSLGIPPNAKLTITYDLQYANGASITSVASPIVQSFTGTTISVYTTDITVPLTNSMKIVA